MKISGRPPSPIGPGGPQGPRGPDGVRPQTGPKPAGLEAGATSQRPQATPLPRPGWGGRAGLLRELGNVRRHQRFLMPRPIFRMLFASLRKMLAAAMAGGPQKPPQMTPKYGLPMLSPGLQPSPRPPIMMKYGVLPPPTGTPPQQPAPPQPPSLVAKYGIAPGASTPGGGPERPPIVAKYGILPGPGTTLPERPTLVPKYGIPFR
jgi:hypothetical protein